MGYPLLIQQKRQPEVSRGAQVEAERDEAVLARRLDEEFERVAAWLEPHFRRREAHEAASLHVKALLSRAERKNAWGLAEAAGKPAPYYFQRLLLRARWDEKAVRADVLAHARDRLGEGGVLVVDETGFLKQGEQSVGVARQYTGTAGRIENCQVGVFLAYETPMATRWQTGSCTCPKSGRRADPSARRLAFRTR